MRGKGVVLVSTIFVCLFLHYCKMVFSREVPEAEVAREVPDSGAGADRAVTRSVLFAKAFLARGKAGAFAVMHLHDEPLNHST